MKKTMLRKWIRNYAEKQIFKPFKIPNTSRDRRSRAWLWSILCSLSMAMVLLPKPFKPSPPWSPSVVPSYRCCLRLLPPVPSLVPPPSPHRPSPSSNTLAFKPSSTSKGFAWPRSCMAHWARAPRTASVSTSAACPPGGEEGRRCGKEKSTWHVVPTAYFFYISLTCGSHI